MDMVAIRNKLKKFAFCPWLVPVWAGCLWLSWEWIPRGFATESRIGNVVDRAFDRERGWRSYQFNRYEAAVYLDDPEHTIIRTPSPRPYQDPSIGYCYLYSRRSRSGWWGMTRHTYSWKISAPTATVRSAYIDWLRTNKGLNDLPAELRERDVIRHAAIPSGYIHNAATLAALALLCTSLVGLGSRALDRRGRRIARGLCPTCGYPSSGLPTPVCPECGERLD